MARRGRSFGASAVPALDRLIRDTTRTVADPGTTGSVYDAWTKDGPASVGRLGSGSGYTTFLDHLGVPSMDLGFSTPGGEYHSSFDDTYQVEHFLDPGYTGQAAAGRLIGVAALRLANADVVPLEYSTYAEQVQAYVKDLQKLGDVVDLQPLLDAAEAWEAATTGLQQRAEALLAGTPSDRDLQRVNATLRRQERLLLTGEGLPGRPWFRHQVYAPGNYTGYAAQFLPGLEDAVKAGDAATATKYRDLLLDSLRAATRDAQR